MALSVKQKDKLASLLDEEQRLEKCQLLKDLSREKVDLCKPYEMDKAIIRERKAKLKADYEVAKKKLEDVEAEVQNFEDQMLRDVKLMYFSKSDFPSRSNLCALEEIHPKILEMDQKHRDQYRELMEQK